MGSDLGDKVGMHLLGKNYWPVKDKDRVRTSLYTIEATAYALMQKLELGLHNETQAIAKWLLEKRELGGGFKSTQVLEASEGWSFGGGGGSPDAVPDSWRCPWC